MTGIYLKCDECGNTFGGEEVEPKVNYPMGLHWSQSCLLKEEARKEGWTGALTRESNSDKCPECSKE